MISKKRIYVTAGVIRDEHGKILLSKRKNNQFMAGYLELPGGKIKQNETKQDALIRELAEELAIQVINMKFRLKIVHHYPSQIVDITIFDVLSYRYKVVAKEGQLLFWLSVDARHKYLLLPTMKRVITSLKLTPYYWITPEVFSLSQLEMQLKKGVRLVQLRKKIHFDSIQKKLLLSVQMLCKLYHAALLLNTAENTEINLTQFDGIHLSTKKLMALRTRPISEEKILGVSVHNQKEITQAARIDADFALLSPILKTSSHPKSAPLGWQKAKDLIKKAKLPVYLLGGLDMSTIDKALSIGAYGISSVSKW